ncbi:unnamed protein product [Cylindrotheca closterium]|uniref:Phytocyanin domain-containing protein n=1 Tax=Cylindrotheca closterium TaxID=2856 RepID=A0AAD2CNQ1_9STRA|nr:unnamed protein product [Cylindrotheca closterium]
MAVLFRLHVSCHDRLSLVPVPVCLFWVLVVVSLFSSSYHQASAEEIEIVIVIDPWIIPFDNLPYPARSAVQGDVVSFRYSGNHNVYVSLHSSSDSQTGDDDNESSFRCDTQNATIVGASGASIANYTLPLSDGSSSSSSSSQSLITTATFFCNYTSHCERGQQLQFNIYPSRDNIPPTQAPSIIPTMLPSTSVPSMAPTVEVTAPPFVPLFNTTFAPTTSGLASQASSRPYLPLMRIWNLSNAMASLLSIVVTVQLLLQ